MRSMVLQRERERTKEKDIDLYAHLSIWLFRLFFFTSGVCVCVRVLMNNLMINFKLSYIENVNELEKIILLFTENYFCLFCIINKIWQVVAQKKIIILYFAAIFYASINAKLINPFKKKRYKYLQLKTSKITKG